MKDRKFSIAVTVTVAVLVTLGVRNAQEKPAAKVQSKKLTYEKDIVPIVKTYCLSCHGSDNENPSDLYMDDFQALMKGGKHGVPVVAGQPEKSPMYYKLLPNPPFGKQMPRGHKKIKPEDVQTIHDWIQQGAIER